MNVPIIWAFHPHTTGTCIFSQEGLITFTLSHPSEKKQSFITYRNPDVIIFLGIVALVTWYRKEYGLTIEESLTHGLLHELSHVGDARSQYPSDWRANHISSWNKFLISVIR